VVPNEKDEERLRGGGDAGGEEMTCRRSMLPQKRGHEERSDNGRQRRELWSVFLADRGLGNISKEAKRGEGGFQKAEVFDL